MPKLNRALVDPLSDPSPQDPRDVYDIKHLSSESRQRTRGLHIFLGKLKGVKILSTGAVFTEAKRSKLFDFTNGKQTLKRKPTKRRKQESTYVALPTTNNPNTFPALPPTYPSNLKRKRIAPPKPTPMAVVIPPTAQRNSRPPSPFHDDSGSDTSNDLTNTGRTSDDDEASGEESSGESEEFSPLLEASMSPFSPCSSQPVSLSSPSEDRCSEGLCWEAMSTDDSSETFEFPPKRTLARSEEVCDNFEDMFEGSFLENEE